MSKSIRRLVLAAAFLLVITGVMADSPFLPGLTVTDPHPNGCVDCHKVDGANDFRISVKLDEMRHPPVNQMINTIPTDCFMCHKPGPTSLSIPNHRNHYRNPGSNTFVTTYGGACLSCHSLNANTGEIGMKSGPKNW